MIVMRSMRDGVVRVLALGNDDHNNDDDDLVRMMREGNVAAQNFKYVRKFV